MPPSKHKGKDIRSRVGTPAVMEGDDGMQGVQNTDEVKPSLTDILERHCRSANPPPSATLQKIHEALTACRDTARERSDKFDRGMRETAQRKKKILEKIRQQEIEEEQKREEEKARTKREAEQEAKSRPPAIGARSLAAQDGTDHDAKDVQIKTQDSPPSLSPTKSASSAEPHQPRPAPAIPTVQTFGEDPSAFDDPTTYHIRDINAATSEEEKKDILGVSEYPHSDLYDLTPGTPPDRDYSAGKSTSQVTALTYSNYLESWIRPITNEDLAFLDERGDRTAPFVMPRRGARSYEEIWAEEDGRAHNAPDPHSDANQPLGSMDQMNDEAAENGEVSAGPVMSRLLSAMIPERRLPASDLPSNINGEQTNAQSVNGDTETTGAGAPGEDQRSKPQPPATQMAEAGLPGWKANPSKMDYAQMDQRALQELRHIGFIEEDAEPDYDAHYDDEIAARLRYLQEELQKQTIINGARKARIAELAGDEVAKQEFGQIADDLDTQLNQAYMKRHRNIGKGKKVLKRPGAVGGGGQSAFSVVGVSKPGVGEQIKGLMERRDLWDSTLGPIVNHGRAEKIEGTIFDEESMKPLLAREQEMWDEG